MTISRELLRNPGSRGGESECQAMGAQWHCKNGPTTPGNGADAACDAMDPVIARLLAPPAQVPDLGLGVSRWPNTPDSAPRQNFQYSSYNSPIPIHPVSGTATRTPTGYYASTSPKAPTAPATLVDLEGVENAHNEQQ